MSNIRLFHYIIEVNKSDSYFVYFQLEATDGLCFYSTLSYEQGEMTRRMDLKGDAHLEPELINLLNSLDFKVEILKKCYI